LPSRDSRSPAPISLHDTGKYEIDSKQRTQFLAPSVTAESNHLKAVRPLRKAEYMEKFDASRSKSRRRPAPAVYLNPERLAMISLHGKPHAATRDFPPTSSPRSANTLGPDGRPRRDGGGSDAYGCAATAMALQVPISSERGLLGRRLSHGGGSVVPMRGGPMTPNYLPSKVRDPLALEIWAAQA
jgi:hypothetical protein